MCVFFASSALPRFELFASFAVCLLRIALNYLTPPNTLRTPIPATGAPERPSLPLPFQTFCHCQRIFFMSEWLFFYYYFHYYLFCSSRVIAVHAKLICAIDFSEAPVALISAPPPQNDAESLQCGPTLVQSVKACQSPQFTTSRRWAVLSVRTGRTANAVRRTATAVNAQSAPSASAPSASVQHIPSGGD